MFRAGDVVVIDFPGVSGVKRRPAVVLLTSQTAAPLGPTDYLLEEWSAAGLRLPTVFRSFFATVPPTTHPVRAGRLTKRDWDGVSNAVKAALSPFSTLPGAG